MEKERKKKRDIYLYACTAHSPELLQGWSNLVDDINTDCAPDTQTRIRRFIFKLGFLDSGSGFLWNVVITRIRIRRGVHRIQSGAKCFYSTFKIYQYTNSFVLFRYTISPLKKFYLAYLFTV